MESPSPRINPGLNRTASARLRRKGLSECGERRGDCAVWEYPSMPFSPARWCERAKPRRSLPIPLAWKPSSRKSAELAPESSVDHLISGLTRFQDKEHLLLVGHNPLLTHASSFLITGKKETSFEIELKKGGLCCIEIDGLPPGTPGTLHWFLTPKQLRQLGD